MVTFIALTDKGILYFENMRNSQVGFWQHLEKAIPPYLIKFNSTMKNQHPFLGRLPRHFFVFCMGLGLFFFVLSCGSSNSEATTDDPTTEAEMAQKTPLEEGKEWYISYCTMCHGEDGKGGGALVSKLDGPPADLTSIALRRGEFDDEWVAKVIAGVEGVPGHSTGDMPNWLETFKETERITDDAVVNEKIDNIVVYLKSIQRK